MKKLFLLGASLFSILGGSSLFAACGAGGCGAPVAPMPAPVSYDKSACGEQPTGDCVCKYVRYEPCYYNTTRCVEEQVPCTKRCCKYVPEYYQVQRCRYVPEYYCETKCRQVPQYYDVCEYKTCKKYVCEPQCTYKPVYYWKRTCNTGCAPTCP